MQEVTEKLFAMQDLEYRAFHSRLVPTLSSDKIIGVRTPALRAYAKEFFKTENAEKFMAQLPHKYYEENNLHGMLIEQIKDYDTCIMRLREFLPYIDNWATCDLLRPKVFKHSTERLLPEIRLWLKSEKTYTVRFAIEMLMTFYLDDNFCDEYPAMVCSVKSDEYYINMMQAWYFATALAKQHSAVLPYIEQYRLEPQTHNMAIQKAVESFRITDEQKKYLKTLKIKSARPKTAKL